MLHTRQCSLHGQAETGFVLQPHFVGFLPHLILLPTFTQQLTCPSIPGSGSASEEHELRHLPLRTAEKTKRDRAPKMLIMSEPEHILSSLNGASLS